MLIVKRKKCSNTGVTIGDHVLDLHIHLAGHVTQEGEDDEAPKDTGHAVPQRNQQGIPDRDKQSSVNNRGVVVYMYMYNNLLQYINVTIYI